MILLAMLAPVTKAGMLFNVNWLFNNFNLLNNVAGVFNLFKFASTVGAAIKSMGLKIVNVFGRKGRSFMFVMSGLAALVTGCVVFFLPRRLDNIRRWRLGRIRGILLEFGHLVSKLGNLFFKSSDSLITLFELLFKFGNASNRELFCFGIQISSSSLPTRLLSDPFRALLEKNIDMPP